ELPPDLIGTTNAAEYLPIWVQQLPADLGALRQSLMNGQAVPRYSAPGAAVQPGPAQAVGAAFSVQASQPFTFTYKTFYFPGWQATLDGQPAPISVSTPEGLISVAVPAGAHTLSFDLGNTPVRVVGDGLSLVAVLFIAGWLVWAGLTPAPSPTE